MRHFIKILFLNFSVLFSVLLSVAAYAQTNGENPLKFNKTSHNFGKFSVKDGKKQCAFEFTNTSGNPIVINNVITSCGCTEPVWPKKPIMPGESGKIEVTYLNDQGPYPFEKTITVYSSASRKPILLRISGIVYEKEKSLKDIFPVAIGPLGIMRNNIKSGQIEQGCVKSGNMQVANLSSRDITVKFENISKGLSLKIEPATIKAGEIAEISYTINTAEQVNWGNTVYSASVVCNGVKAAEKLNINAMIIDKVSGLTKEQKNSGSMVLAKNSSINLGDVAKGKQAEAVFMMRNTGAGELIIHKADTNGMDFTVSVPHSIKPGDEFTVKANIDSNRFYGEQVFTITLVTNSPNRPLVNLFISANIN